MLSHVVRLPWVMLLLVWPLPAIAAELRKDDLSAAQAAKVDAAVAAEMARQQIVGTAIGIIREGQIVYLRGYGDADRERHQPITLETVFNWASNSKPMAAVAAMQLVEKKQLDLDADVRQYVSEFPEKESVITTRQLLCHQGGIQHYGDEQLMVGGLWPVSGRPAITPFTALIRFKHRPLVYQPGESTLYSSYAFVLLSAIIERAGGERFTTQIERRIAEPLEMKSLQLDVETREQPGWSTGYVKNSNGRVIPAREEANYWKYGAGGYKSNIQDFARWAAALMNHELVSAAAERQMWTPQNTARGDATTRGLGFVVEQENGLKVSHGGTQPEATSRLVIYPDARHGVVVMCNCGFAKPAAISTAVYKAMRDQ